MTDSSRIVWIDAMLPKEEVITLYSHAAVFVCPSVYEPFGIINLEAMACGTPVVAARVGGIPEIVVPGETGLLVDLDQHEDGFTPRHPERYARALADGSASYWATPTAASRWPGPPAPASRSTSAGAASPSRRSTFTRRCCGKRAALFGRTVKRLRRDA